MKACVIIPARMTSTRFPGKPLAKILGRPMIEWVWEAACLSKAAAEIIVATDSLDIVKACEKFGCRAVITSSTCRTGTERVAEAARNIDADIIVNLQCDEPAIRPRTITAVIDELQAGDIPDDVGIVTAAMLTSDAQAFKSRDVVKVVTDRQGNALYFSRAGIPVGERIWLRHVGLYGFTKRALFEVATLSPPKLEQTEQLEQLRALWWGYRIRVVEMAYPAVSVDTPDDIPRAALALNLARDHKG